MPILDGALGFREGQVSVPAERVRPLPAGIHRVADVLRYLHYVRVPRDDGVEYWRRTLDRL